MCDARRGMSVVDGRACVIRTYSAAETPKKDKKDKKDKKTPKEKERKQKQQATAAEMFEEYARQCRVDTTDVRLFVVPCSQPLTNGGRMFA